MRKDMGKVLTERPRHGSRYAKPYNPDRNVDLLDEDSAPSKKDLNAGKKYGYHQKEFSDLISPLYGYLRKACGRPWDDVYSEICQTVKGTGTLALHLRGHFDDAVETKPTFKDGVPYTSDGRYKVTSYRRAAFYVDPKGILRQAPKQERYKYKRPPPEVVFLNGRVYKNVDGIWYEAVIREHKLEPTTKWEERQYKSATYEGKPYRVQVTTYPHVSDHLFGRIQIDQLAYYYGRSGIYCTGKRQLNKKELATLRAALAKTP